MEGIILKEVVQIQSNMEDCGRCQLLVESWSAGLVTKLLEVTHGQWLYQNVHVQDVVQGEKVINRKEMICRELETQLELGEEGLEEEDHYLLEINLDDLDNSTWEDQTYWLLALKMAREA